MFFRKTGLKQLDVYLIFININIYNNIISICEINKIIIQLQYKLLALKK